MQNQPVTLYDEDVDASGGPVEITSLPIRGSGLDSMEVTVDGTLTTDAPVFEVSNHPLALDRPDDATFTERTVPFFSAFAAPGTQGLDFPDNARFAFRGKVNCTAGTGRLTIRVFRMGYGSGSS